MGLMSFDRKVPVQFAESGLALGIAMYILYIYIIPKDNSNKEYLQTSLSLCIYIIGIIYTLISCRLQMMYFFKEKNMF